jgi:hypothetical protein
MLARYFDKLIILWLIIPVLRHAQPPVKLTASNHVVQSDDENWHCTFLEYGPAKISSKPHNNAQNVCGVAPPNKNIVVGTLNF